MTSYRLTAMLLACALGSAGCLGTVTPPPSISELEGVETCKVARDPLNPYVVEWRGAELTNLEAASNRGVVVVSYAGCTLKVLPGCHVGGEYKLESTSPNRDTISIDTKEKLYAALPLGAASLSAQIEGGRGLRFDYVALGVRIASEPPTTLSGDCEGANHYVRAITVGAFDLTSTAQEKAALDAKLANTAGGGLSHEGAGAFHKKSGDVDACSKSPDGAQCGSFLQLSLTKLPSAPSAGGGQSTGFGAGLSALVQAPTVGELDAPALGAFAKLDVALLERVQLATRADKNATLKPNEKAAAWRHVADSASADAAVSKAATARYDEWMRLAAAEATHLEQLKKLGKQWRADREKLTRLLKLDEQVVSREKKAAYIVEFDTAYLPLVKDLAEYEVKFGTAAWDGNGPPPDVPSVPADAPPPAEGEAGPVAPVEAPTPNP